MLAALRYKHNTLKFFQVGENMQAHFFFHPCPCKFHWNRIFEDEMPFELRCSETYVFRDRIGMRQNNADTIEMAEKQIGFTVRPQLATEVAKLLGDFALCFTMLDILAFDQQDTLRIRMPRQNVNVAVVDGKFLLQELADGNFGFRCPSEFDQAH